MKTPESNPMFSSDKRYLLEICARYNAVKHVPQDDKLQEAKLKLENTTATMKTSMVMMVSNQEQAKVSAY